MAILLSITSNVCSMECSDISTRSRAVVMMNDFMLMVEDVFDEDDDLFELIIFPSFSGAVSDWFGFISRLT